MKSDVASQLRSHCVQFGRLQGVSFARHNELLAVNIENHQARANIFLQGAQLSHYQRHGEQPLLWLSSLCDFEAGQPLRGGIPICWPWFGNLERNNDAVRALVKATPATTSPDHGLVRQREWDLADIEIVSDDLTVVTLRLDFTPDTDPMWPYSCALQLRIEIGETLVVALSILNQDQRPLTFSGALHSYLAVGDIEELHVTGLEGVDYVDALRNWRDRTQRGSITISGEIDRIYRQAAAECRVIDHHWQRNIGLRSEGSRSTVIWNPWREKARHLPCFADQAYRKMLCIETANAADDCVELRSGAAHTLSVTFKLGA